MAMIARQRHFQGPEGTYTAVQYTLDARWVLYDPKMTYIDTFPSEQMVVNRANKIIGQQTEEYGDW